MKEKGKGSGKTFDILGKGKRPKNDDPKPRSEGEQLEDAITKCENEIFAARLPRSCSSSSKRWRSQSFGPRLPRRMLTICSLVWKMKSVTCRQPSWKKRVRTFEKLKEVCLKSAAKVKDVQTQMKEYKGLLHKTYSKASKWDTLKKVAWMFQQWLSQLPSLLDEIPWKKGCLMVSAVTVSASKFACLVCDSVLFLFTVSNSLMYVDQFDAVLCFKPPFCKGSVELWMFTLTLPCHLTLHCQCHVACLKLQEETYLFFDPQCCSNMSFKSCYVNMKQFGQQPRFVNHIHF